MANGTRVHHGKQENATTAYTGQWYIIEYGMKVHQLRQDEGTSQKTGELRLAKLSHSTPIF